MNTGCEIARFDIVTANAWRLARFYEDAFGCNILAAEHLSGPDFEKQMDVEGGAECVTLGLGREIVRLLRFDRPGRPYPTDSPASDLIFQHCAIVVADMHEAWERLRGTGGWSAITHGSPQRLPDSSGGVTAFKFRDPEGHPLELLLFPDGRTPGRWQVKSRDEIFLGIDHSAICVADSAVSCAFYENLGFVVSGRTLNSGPGQEKLDGVPGAVVDVTALVTADTLPHLELLHYRAETSGAPGTKSNDIAATRIVLACRDSGHGHGISLTHCALDPDGHHLTLMPAR
jgi:catechol 2,3-dioxygenase-like lactoylglutathione lyase family enzyme